MGRQVSSKMGACFLCIMRGQFEDLFICEKRHPKSAKKSTRKNWHLKSAKRGSAYVQKTTRKNWHLKCAKKNTRKNWHLKSAK